MDSFDRQDFRTPFRHTNYTPQSLDSLTDLSITNVSARPYHYTPSNRATVASSFAPSSAAFVGQTFMEEDEDLTVNAQGYLLQDDPGIAACHHMYDDFSRQLRDCSMQHQVFDLVSRYERACHDVVAYLWKLTRKALPLHSKLQRTSDTLLLIKSEQQTWRLIGSLYSDRINIESCDTEDIMHDGLDRYASELDLTNNLMKYNTRLRQAQLIVDWLEFNSEEQLEDHYNKVEFSVDAMGSWENSLHMLKKGQKGGVSYDLLNLVTKLDPDAPIRERGRRLADLDEEDDAKLLNYVYCCIRAGRIDEAQKVCRKVGQIWRAATLEGWRLYHDPNVRQLGPGGTTVPVLGNPNRDIWKRSCWKMAEDNKISLIERGIYAALSGNLEQLLPHCHSWHDQLWAYFRVYVDQNVENNLHDHFIGTRPLVPLPSAYTDRLLTYDGIFSAIEASPFEEVRIGSLSRFNVIQKYIVLNDTTGLIHVMSDWCSREDIQSHPHLVRFMAHLVLFFQTLGMSLDENECNTVLTKYIQLLMTDRHNKLIAMYVSKLPNTLQTPWYAKFLEGIVDSLERRQCLDSSRECNLDVSEIRRLVVNNIRTADSDEDLVIESDVQLDGSATQSDQQKISSIEWLTMEPAMLYDALKQTNAISRVFLLQRKLVACREATKQLPSNIIDKLMGSSRTKAAASIDQLPANVSNAIREQLCIKAYLDAQDTFSDWFKHYHNAKPIKPTCSTIGINFTERVAYEEQEKQYRVDVDRWQQSVDYLTDLVESKINNVLLFPDGGWMTDNVAAEVDNDDVDRVRQMELLRRVCLPALCQILHKVLHTTGQYKKCLQLADLIASEHYKLYGIFRTDDLRKLLEQLRTSAIALLDQGLDPLGYPLYD